MRVVLLADSGPESNKAGPLGLLTIVLLGIAVYFLYRSMVRHLNKVPESFDEPAGTGDEPAGTDRAVQNGSAQNGSAHNGSGHDGSGHQQEPPAP